MGEFTKDIKGLPNPQSLYEAKLERDRQKLFEEQTRLSGTLESIKQYMMTDIEASNGRDAIEYHRGSLALQPLIGLEPQAVKEAQIVLKKWLGLYDYKLVMGKAIVPIKPGFWGWFDTQFRCHGARCSVSEGWLVFTIISSLFALTFLFIGVCTLPFR